MEEVKTKNISLKEIEEKGLYQGFCLRPDTSGGIIKMYKMNNKAYDIYFDEEQTRVEKIIEWNIQGE